MEKFFDQYYAIDEHIEKAISSRKERQEKLAKALGRPMTKVAFDPKYFDSELEVNPRRNLQNFHSSSSIMSEEFSKKLGVCKRLYDITTKIKDKFEREPEYQESYCRVLYTRLERALRESAADSKYSGSQQSLGSISHIEEIMYDRYRLSFDDIMDKSGDEVMNIIMARDPKLLHLDPMVGTEAITKINNAMHDGVLSKIISGAGDKTVTIKVTDGKKSRDDDFHQILASITKELDPIISSKTSDILKELTAQVKQHIDSEVDVEKRALADYKKKIQSEMENLRQNMMSISGTRKFVAKSDDVEQEYDEDEDEDQDILDGLAELKLMLGK